MQGTTIGDMNGETRSLDYSLDYAVQQLETRELPEYGYAVLDGFLAMATYFEFLNCNTFFLQSLRLTVS